MQYDYYQQFLWHFSPVFSGPSYLPRHPYYGPRMPPPPGSQRPPLFHQQPSPSPGPQQPSQMRLPQAQSAYPPMYRDGR